MCKSKVKVILHSASSNINSHLLFPNLFMFLKNTLKRSNVSELDLTLRSSFCARLSFYTSKSALDLLLSAVLTLACLFIVSYKNKSDLFLSVFPSTTSLVETKGGALLI